MNTLKHFYHNIQYTLKPINNTSYNIPYNILSFVQTVYHKVLTNRIQYFKIETSLKLKQAKRSVSLDPKKLRWGFSCFWFTI